MSLIISGAAVIDGVAPRPVEDGAVWIEGARIKRVCRRDELRAPPGAKVIDARGKYVIPGLMNANVHLLMDIRLENLVRYMGRYDELIVEAAQITLQNGVTTVFDTYGPRRFLMAGRDRINAGATPGSRIFCAGNIVGFDGPFSEDFSRKAEELASTALSKRINSIWVENVGRHLMWLTPEQVATEVRAYIAKGIDFVKYASNEHFGSSHGAFLTFSPQVQTAIVGEAHHAGVTAQAHTLTVEGLRIAVEAGCDLIQHANHTGPALIPQATLESMARRRTGAVVFAFTQERLDHLMQSESHRRPAEWQAADTNARNLARCGAPVLLATDGYLLAPEALTDPFFSRYMGRGQSVLAGNRSFFLAQSHGGERIVANGNAQGRDAQYRNGLRQGQGVGHA
jgi:imidazolonepropionase-like amidohydrolase